MVVELGKVTEETQNQTVIPMGHDEIQWRFCLWLGASERMVHDWHGLAIEVQTQHCLLKEILGVFV